jgi:hypothetical protein
MTNYERALQWRDNLNGSHYFTYPEGISQKELDAICKEANAHYERIGSNKRVSNHMGELIPARVGGWANTIDN